MEWWPDANRNPGRLNLGICTPALRGERPLNGGSIIVRPPDWREAGIFVVREGGTSAASPAQAGRASDHALPSLTATPDSITALQRQELFVAGNAAGGRP